MPIPNQTVPGQTADSAQPQNVVDVRFNPNATGVQAATVLRAMADHFESLGNEPLRVSFEKGSANLRVDHKPH